MPAKEFEEIYKTHYADVYRFLFRTCGGNQDTAEELTQETFCEAFRTFYRFNPEQCTVVTWLCAVGKNVWFHYLRKHRNTIVPLEGLEESLCDDNASPEEYAEKAELGKKLRALLDEMRPKYREVLLLRSSGLAFAEVAAVMGITENSAKVLFFRARNHLKEKIENEGLL